jgi:hypothetical protein
MIYPCLIVAGISFFYKIYLQSKLRNENRKSTIFSVMLRTYTILDFLPLRKGVRTPEEMAIRKKANISLIVFYASILLGLIIAALAR